MVREALANKARPDDLDIEPQPEKLPLPDGHVAVFGPFATAHEDGAPFEVDIAQPQRDELLAAQVTGVEDLQHGQVSESEGL